MLKVNKCTSKIWFGSKSCWFFQSYKLFRYKKKFWKYIRLFN